MYAVEIQGVTVRCDTPEEVLALLPMPSLQKIESSLATAATLAEALGKPARKKPGPKPRAKKADDDVLTPELKAKLAAEVPLICRKPHGCGKLFESKNRMAWYCPACTAKRDEGRAV